MSKGKYKGTCNRSSCGSDKDVTWWNHSTRKFYCVNCAQTLNYENLKDSIGVFGHRICTPCDTEMDVNGIEEKINERIKIYPDSRFVSDDEVTIALLLCKLEDQQKAFKTELGIPLNI